MIIMKNSRYVHVIETCAGCGHDIYTKTQKYIKSPDGRFFHINHHRKNSSTHKPPKHGHVPGGLADMINKGKGIL